jgi:hypothetical protein
MIFLNLFLAILLDNFEVEEEEEEDPNHVSLIMKLNSFKSSIYERISDKFNDILWKLHLWRLKRKKEEMETPHPPIAFRGIWGVK